MPKAARSTSVRRTGAHGGFLTATKANAPPKFSKACHSEGRPPVRPVACYRNKPRSVTTW